MSHALRVARDHCGATVSLRSRRRLGLRLRRTEYLPGQVPRGDDALVMQAASAPVRLSDLVATLSLVADLGMGRPMERVLRQTVITLRLAEAAGVEDSVRAAAYYTSLLTWVGCAADTSELAELFGDETHLYADTHDGDLGGISMAVFVAR